MTLEFLQCFCPEFCHSQHFVSNYSLLFFMLEDHWNIGRHCKKKKKSWTTSCLSATLLLFLNEDFKLVAKSRCKVLLKYITELTNYACNWFTAEALFPVEFIGDTSLKSLWNPATNQSPLAYGTNWSRRGLLVEHSAVRAWIPALGRTISAHSALLSSILHHSPLQICQAPMQIHGCFCMTSGNQNMSCYSRSLSRVLLTSKPSKIRILSSKGSSATQEFKILIWDTNKQSRKGRKN